jgi:hypothetical protein
MKDFLFTMVFKYDQAQEARIAIAKIILPTRSGRFHARLTIV